MPISQSVFKPQLRIFYKLDERLLSEEFIQKIGTEEGRVDYVDAEKARDFAWSEEIMEARIGAALVDEDGDILAEFKGPTALARAEAARGSVKVTFDMGIDTGDADIEEVEEDIPTE